MGSDSVVLLSCTFYKVMGSECIILLIFGINYDQTCSDRPECFPVFKYFYVLYQNFRLECWVNTEVEVWCEQASQSRWCSTSLSLSSMPYSSVYHWAQKREDSPTTPPV